MPNAIIKEIVFAFECEYCKSENITGDDISKYCRCKKCGKLNDLIIPQAFAKIISYIKNEPDTWEIYKKKLKEFKKLVASDPEIAQKFLQSAGIVDENGELTEHYKNN